MDGFSETIEFWHWWILAGILLVLEMFAPSTFFLWLGLSASVVGILIWIVPSLSWDIQVMVFAVLAIASILLWRMYLKKHPIKTDQPVLNRRGEQYIGRVFTLEEPIVNGVGKIKVDDTTWKIHGNDMDSGSQVKVIGTEGVILTVEVLT